MVGLVRNRQNEVQDEVPHRGSGHHGTPLPRRPSPRCAMSWAARITGRGRRCAVRPPPPPRGRPERDRRLGVRAEGEHPVAAQQDGLRTRSRLDQLDAGGDRGGRGHRDLLRLAQAGQRFVPGRQRRPPGRTPAGAGNACGSPRRPVAWPGTPPCAWPRPRCSSRPGRLRPRSRRGGPRRGHRARDRVSGSAWRSAQCRARPGPRGQRAWSETAPRRAAGPSRHPPRRGGARSVNARPLRRLRQLAPARAWSSPPPYDTSVRPPG